MTAVIRSLRGAGLGALLYLCVAACGEGLPAAVGDLDDIVVAAQPELWGRIQRRLETRLEPSHIATRGVRAFQVSHADPAQEAWVEQRRARQLLLIGTATDPWVEEALSHLGGQPLAAPALAETGNVWAQDQRVMVLLVPDGDAPGAVFDRLDELRTLYDQRYREWVVGRVFTAGTNQALADTLLAQSAFSVLIPRDYEWTRAEDTYLFRKTEPDSAGVIRHITVTWRSPIPRDMQGAGLLGWRQQVAAEHYGIRQRVWLANVKATQTTHRGNLAFQLVGMWENTRRDGPPRGPFILRAVVCQSQDRIYLLDAWLWTPDQEQNAHLVELESITNSFRCGSARSKSAHRIGNVVRGELDQQLAVLLLDPGQLHGERRARRMVPEVPPPLEGQVAARAQMRAQLLGVAREGPEQPRQATPLSEGRERLDHSAALPGDPGQGGMVIGRLVHGRQS